MPSAAPQFFESDLVLRGQELMTVRSVDHVRGTVECVWYVPEGRRTGTYASSELQLLAPAPDHARLDPQRSTAGMLVDRIRGELRALAASAVEQAARQAPHL